MTCWMHRFSAVLDFRRSVLPFPAPILPSQGSVDELVTSLDPAKVFFGLLRFDLGQGSFARTKYSFCRRAILRSSLTTCCRRYVFIHWNGESSPAVKRGRWNATMGQALMQIGMTPTVTIEFQDRADVTMEKVLTALQKACVNDGDIGDSSFSIDKLKADFEAMLKKAESMNLEEVDPNKLPTANDMKRKFTWEQAHKLVAQVGPPPGPFNWMLVRHDPAHPELHNAGGGGVEEFCQYLDDDKVLYGLLRMGFGRGTFRRTKLIFIHWSGPAVSAVKRGQCVSRLSVCDMAMPHGISCHRINHSTWARLVLSATRIADTAQPTQQYSRGPERGIRATVGVRSAACMRNAVRCRTRMTQVQPARG